MVVKRPVRNPVSSIQPGKLAVQVLDSRKIADWAVEMTGLSIDRVRLSPSSADSSGQMLRCRPSEETMEVVDRSSLS